VSLDFRATRPDERRAAAEAMVAALMSPPPTDEQWERGAPSWEEMTSYSAWDDDRCVGHVGQFVVDTVVPGGARLATGAVSRVGVLGTYRRRGVASTLMRELIADSDRNGYPLMSLRASEATIYERFGFGMAGEYAAVTIDPRRARPIRGADPSGTFRLLRRDEILDRIPPLYEHAALGRVGAITRTPSFTTRYFRDAIEGTKASFVVVHSGADGVDDGYVHFENGWDEEHADGPQGKGEVHDLFGATPAVELALWQFVCDVDLVTTWRANERPVDDVLRWAASDPRAYRVRGVDDEQWVRLVDVETALSSRTYGPVDGVVRVAVTDALVPRNEATWEVDADGARRTDAAPDILTDIAGISAAYLGGTSWHTIAATGRATGDASAVATADHLFAVTPLPFCGSFF
jgi:predicted acetyltransferase